MTDYILALDIGTQSSRAAALDLEGNVVADASTPLSVSNPRAGWAEQEPEVWWESSVGNIRKVVAQIEGRGRLAAVGAGGQMHGTVPIDREGKVLARSVQLWCDKRGADFVEALKESADLDRAVSLTGNPPAPSWSGFKIKWLKRFEPELYARTWKILMPKDFINFRLTGEVATDFSEASGSFVMDGQKKQWSREMADLLDIDLAKMPPIFPASAPIGKVTREAARATGIDEGIPVVAGAGDMLCLLLGAGITRVGRACDTSGTASIISFFVEKPVFDPRLMNLHHAMPGWIAFGILDSGGGSFKWWKDNFCEPQTRQAEEEGISPYAALTREAQNVPPGSEGLIFLPYLLGERTLGSAASRGVLFGITPRHTRAYVTRAIIEGICFELRQSLEILREHGLAVEEIRTSGGGARSPLWSQIKADIYKVPVQGFTMFEGGILGAMMVAAVGAGFYADEAGCAERLVRLGERFVPDERAASQYDKFYRLFKDLHDKLQDDFRKLSGVS